MCFELNRLSRLIGEMGQKQKAYMEEIRSGLVQFREKMDDTIQMVRESNTKFIIAFKLVIRYDFHSWHFTLLFGVLITVYFASLIHTHIATTMKI